MTENEIYFIELLSSFLSQSKPPVNKNADWQSLYSLSKSHDVTAVIAAMIPLLPKEYSPDKQLKSIFNQVLGQTLINYSEKQKNLQKLLDCLNEAKISHMLVKGAETAKLYPVPELRTSGDTDVLVEPKDYEQVTDILSSHGFSVEQKKSECTLLTSENFHYEIHNCLESINSESKNLFSDPFSPEISENTCNYTYRLNSDYALFYTVLHLLYHIKAGGAGMRMLMDVDVLSRNDPKSVNHSILLSKKCNLLHSFKCVFTLANHWFSTPVDNSFLVDDEEFIIKMTDTMLNGGVFGFENGHSGAVFLAKQQDNDGGKLSALTRLKAFFRYILPAPEYIYNQCEYARKHHFLLPIAYIDRIFQGIFLRGRHSLKSIETISGKNEPAQNLYEIMKELEIN